MRQSRLHSLKCKRWLAALTAFLALLPLHGTLAQTFTLPTDNSTIVGTPKMVLPTGRNTLLDIARHFDLGYHEITWANPNIDVWIPEQDGHVVIPTQFILPPKPWAGIVINISQRRLFYFPTPAKGEQATVITLPVSIAREGWSTPLGETRVVGKHKDPGWFVPKSIREEHRAEEGTEFPEYFPPGPDNPMGMLAIALGFKSIFIHGTNRPWGIGMRTSHGCLHLYPENAVTLFDMINTGVPVRVIDEPIMVGIQRNQLFMVHYEPVQEYGTTTSMMTRAVLALAPYLQSTVIPKTDTAKTAPAQVMLDVDWDRVRAVLARPQVLPVSVAPAGDSLDDTLNALVPEHYTEAPFDADANNAKPPDRSKPAPDAQPEQPVQDAVAPL